MVERTIEGLREHLDGFAFRLHRRSHWYCFRPLKVRYDRRTSAESMLTEVGDFVVQRDPRLSVNGWSQAANKL